MDENSNCSENYVGEGNVDRWQLVTLLLFSASLNAHPIYNLCAANNHRGSFLHKGYK